jgi:hypothetical protein
MNMTKITYFVVLGLVYTIKVSGITVGISHGKNEGFVKIV